MKDALYWITKLHLLEHPEGGFYKETYRSLQTLSADHSTNASHKRNLCTAIYFLLRSKDRSVFHKIKSDEIWHFHTGSSILIYSLSATDGIKIDRLGIDCEAGDQPQLMIPANTWFAALVEQPDSFGLSSCTVSPGFDFRDFEIAERNKLIEEFPSFETIILKLT